MRISPFIDSRPERGFRTYGRLGSWLQTGFWEIKAGASLISPKPT